MLDENSIKERMQKTVENARRDLAKIRTGTASPAILDNVFVERLWRSLKAEHTKPAGWHTRCRNPYNRPHRHLSVGAARTGELVPRPTGHNRRIRIMSRTRAVVAPPRP